MRGFVDVWDAAGELGVTPEEITKLCGRGELKPDREGVPLHVSRASLDRLKKARQRSFGALAHAVFEREMHGRGEQLARIYGAAATTVSTEGTGMDGGFLVPASYASTILAPFFGGFNIPAKTLNITTPKNSIAFPIDRRPPHDETSGIVAYWVDEGDPIPQSKPALEAIANKLHKLAGIVPVTDELLADAPALGAYLEIGAGEALIYKASLEILRGLGAGRPLGILNSPALITVAAEAGPQTADTIVAANVARMYARMATNSLPSAQWLVHPDGLGQLIGLTINGGVVYTAGDAEAPVGRLLNCPIVPHEGCSALGDIGDIIFADLKQYITATKDPAISTMTSMHFWFDRDLMAFKFVMRFAGQPAWAAPVESRVGGNTRSPFIALAAR